MKHKRWGVLVSQVSNAEILLKLTWLGAIYTQIVATQLTSENTCATRNSNQSESLMVRYSSAISVKMP